MFKDFPCVFVETGYGMLRNQFYCSCCILAQLVCVISAGVTSLNAIADEATGSMYVRAEIENNVTGTCTVTLYQNTTDLPATTLVLFLIVDSNATILPQSCLKETSNQYVQLASSQQDAGFLVADTLYTIPDDMAEKTCLAFALYKMNGTGGLCPGALLSFTLELAQDADGQPVAWIESATEEAPLFISDTSFYSSAATLDAKQLSVIFESLAIVANCESLSPPDRVNASWHYRDKIIVKWKAPVADNALEYRVYRSATDTFAEAIPVNESWTTELTWTDSFDENATGAPPAGCSCTSIHYYYWIRARDTATKCVSDFSAPPARGTVINW